LRQNEAATELTAAELLSLGEYFNEARRALDRFRHLAAGDDQRMMNRADKLDAVLDEHRKKQETGRDWGHDINGRVAEGGDARRVTELLAEIDELPTSWRLYEDLTKELVLAGRMNEAVDWADRCVARCLGRSEQISARGLAMEIRGLQTMSAEAPRAAKLYAVGAFEPARRALDSLLEANFPFDTPLHYLLGRCQLETGMPDAASASFRAAFELCQQPIYRPVLRQLTEDIDQAYLAVARGTIDARVKSGDFDEAIAESGRVFSRLKKPEVWLVDMARMYCGIALGRLRGEQETSIVPDIDLPVPWRDRLLQALRAENNIERAIALAELARELDPTFAPRAEMVFDRAMALRRQFAAAASLERASQLLAKRNFEATLSLINGLDPAIAGEPRLRRLRILALLGANRFQEADEAVAGFGETNSAEMREFLANYPSFAVRQRIALAHAMLREGKAREVLAALETLVAGGATEEMELAYCRAFAVTLEAYEHGKHGDRARARRSFEAALMLLEPHIRQPGTPAHVTELYNRLDMEAEQYVG
jgi:tetratricopeptide (TPR) repeat protein